MRSKNCVQSHRYAIIYVAEYRTRLEQDPVFDTSGLEVDKRDVKIDQSNAALLTVSLPELKPGKYKVVWHVVSVDTHVTTGDFAFEVTR
jgi:methionine-rich copper-binding protein CopC